MAATMTARTTMKAVRIHSFGGPDVLRFEEAPKPEPKPNELLVRIKAAGVNPVDWKIREGHLGKPPLPSIMGSDFSGEVESLGANVTPIRFGNGLAPKQFPTGFSINEPVFGVVSDESGGYAEYAVAPASQVVRKPDSLSHFEAAALPIASLTAWQALFDAAKLEAGQKVLIHAAAGGVGGFAVQLAKWKGAHVIGTASGSRIQSVRELGADEVVDYRTAKFEEIVRDADVVFDTIGGETQERSWKVLAPGGILVSIVQPPSEAAAAAKGLRAAFVICDAGREGELAQIAELAADRRLKIPIATVLPLSEARQAQQLSQSGHTQGKIILRVSED